MIIVPSKKPQFKQTIKHNKHKTLNKELTIYMYIKCTLIGVKNNGPVYPGYRVKKLQF